MIISNHAVKDSYTLAVNSLISDCKYTTALETLTNEIEPQFRAIRALITDTIARCLNADMDYDDWNEFLGGLERDFYTSRDEAFRRLITITKKGE